MPSFEITPIGTVRNNRTDVQHTDNWGAVRSTIAIDARFGEACLQGLDAFSHVDVLFIFDQFPEHDDHREPRPYSLSEPIQSEPIQSEPIQSEPIQTVYNGACLTRFTAPNSPAG
jgi:tRNA (Thr-GGU) A37 N-methylase